MLKQLARSRLFICSGEPSGDLYARLLIEKLKKFTSKPTIYCVGGRELHLDGVKLVQDARQLQTFGLNSSLFNFKKNYYIYRQIARTIYRFQPEVFIPIAYPGINLLLCRYAKRLGMKVYYFLPPQIWAWAGFRKYFIKKWVDQVISVFPFEYRFYKKVGIETFYFKNPLLSHLKSYRRRDFRCRIGLMPGSRFDQIKRNLVVMRKLIKEFYKFKNNIEFCLILYDRVDSLKVQIPAQIKVITQNRYQAMKDCDLLIISSGTASLEARIMSIPQIFVHRPAVFDYYFFRRFIRIKEYNLANLYFNNRDVPAYISPDSNYLSEKLFNHIQDILPSLGLKW